MVDFLENVINCSGDSRFCKKCNEIKPISEFRKSKRKEGKGFRYRCIVCEIKSYSDFYYRHGKSEYHRKKKYGLTPEQFNKLLENQHFKCKICKNKFSSKRTTHVDHCHKTNIIRGILCNTCNTALGHYEKSSGLFEKYLSSNFKQYEYYDIVPYYELCI